MSLSCYALRVDVICPTYHFRGVFVPDLLFMTDFVHGGRLDDDDYGRSCMLTHEYVQLFFTPLDGHGMVT